MLVAGGTRQAESSGDKVARYGYGARPDGSWKARTTHWQTVGPGQCWRVPGTQVRNMEPPRMRPPKTGLRWDRFFSHSTLDMAVVSSPTTYLPCQARYLSPASSRIWRRRWIPSSRYFITDHIIGSKCDARSNPVFHGMVGFWGPLEHRDPISWLVSRNRSKCQR
jgi:hypothetical protein